jgi:type II secretion system protein N
VRTFFLLVSTGVWCLLVFVATLWATFPSEELGLRLRAEVPARLGRQTTADVGEVSPWWVGLTAHDLKLYQSGAGGAELLAVFDSASIAVSPFRSLVRRTPYFSGQLTMLDGELGFQVGTAQMGKKGNTWGISDLVAWSDGVPIGDLLRVTDRVPGTLVGNVSLDVDVRGGSEGLSAADGHVTIEGSGLTLSDVEVPGVGPLGMEIPIDKVSIAAKVEKGQATIDHAIVTSSLFTLEIKGTVGLRDPFERSNVDVEVVLSGLGSEFQAYEGFLSAAKGTDGNYHFFCRGIASRLSVASCSPGKPSASRLGRRTAADEDPDVEGGDGLEEPVLTPSESDDERAKRRAEIRERLRERREARRAERLGKPTTPVEAEPAPVASKPVPDEEEPPVLDELPPDEDPVDEIGPDDEEPPIE